MNKNFARLLKDQDQVHYFLTTVLGVDHLKFNGISYKIINSELGILEGLNSPTSTQTRFRDRKYDTEEKRLALRKRIVTELYTGFLPSSDEKIKLGVGGARPERLRRGKQAFILIGLPASGKSTVARRIANKYGAIILDSDFAKRKLPEFSKYPWGASIVHAESTLILFGDESQTGFQSLLSMAVDNKVNLVIPKTGEEPDDIIPYCKKLKNLGYHVSLSLVFLPKEKATVRALGRFKTTERYVPLSTIFDVYGENPVVTYFSLKNRQVSYIDSYGIINTDVPLNEPPVCTDLQGSNPANLFRFKKNRLI